MLLATVDILISIVIFYMRIINRNLHYVDFLGDKGERGNSGTTGPPGGPGKPGQKGTEIV